MDSKLHFSLMISKSGVAGFDWHSTTSLTDSKSRICTKVRSGTVDKTKRMVTQNPSGALLLGKLSLPLVGGRETCVV